jgi:CRP/FNR family transcriptional regulator, cyclic AMP receptor protein
VKDIAWPGARPGSEGESREDGSGGRAARTAADLRRRPDDALEAVAREVVVRTYPKGAIVVSAGEPAEACYVIAEGSAKVFVSSSAGGDQILATLRPLDAFGVIALLDGGSRSASVEALEPLTLVATARSTFLGLVDREPSIANALLRSTGLLVCRLTGQAADLIFLDLEGRVAKLLVELVERNAKGTVPRASSIWASPRATSPRWWEGRARA